MAKKFQFNYEYYNAAGKNIIRHCITVFDTREQAEKALQERIADLNDEGFGTATGEIVEIEEELL